MSSEYRVTFIYTSCHIAVSKGGCLYNLDYFKMQTIHEKVIVSGAEKIFALNSSKLEEHEKTVQIKI